MAMIAVPRTLPAANPVRRLFHSVSLRRSISASRLPTRPPPAPPGQVYQPFRPPSSPLPAKYRSLSPIERLDVLRDRLGLWYDYAPLLSSLLTHEGFTPSSIEEITGIMGSEQNRLIVGAQVRESLVSSGSDVLAFFDFSGGADLLYELRFLNTDQRAAAARRVVDLGLGVRETQDLARAIKDFTRRKGEDGWESFSGDRPGDCVAYAEFRLSREQISVVDRVAVLERAIEVVETEGARERVEEELRRATSEEEAEERDAAEGSPVQVVRLRYGEVATATTVALLPVVRQEDGEEGIASAPVLCKSDGEMGVVTSGKPWGRWAVLPGWGPVAALESGVVLELADARAIPWRRGRWEKEEKVLVVGERARKEVSPDGGFYIVNGHAAGEGSGGKLGIQRGKDLAATGVCVALAEVVLVVRRPVEDDDDQLSDEDWA